MDETVTAPGRSRDREDRLNHATQPRGDSYPCHSPVSCYWRYTQFGMSYGYWVSVFGPGLEEHKTTLDAGSGLETDLDQLREFLKDWITRPLSGELYENIGHLTITLTGPFESSELASFGKTVQERISSAETDEERFGLLGRAAMDRFNAGDHDQALLCVQQLLDMVPTQEDNPFYGDAVMASNTVLGRIALVEGRLDDAKQHLVRAGQVPGSPTLNTFGPNMSLARDLLLLGETNSVLDYLKACESFWGMGSGDLMTWRQAIESGQIPNFGANLDY